MTWAHGQGGKPTAHLVGGEPEVGAQANGTCGHGFKVYGTWQPEVTIAHMSRWQVWGGFTICKRCAQVTA